MVHDELMLHDELLKILSAANYCYYWRETLILTVFVWLWPMTGADLLRENSTADWLVTGGWY